MLGGFVAFMERGELHGRGEVTRLDVSFPGEGRPGAHLEPAILWSQMGLQPTLLWRPAACPSFHCLQRDFFLSEVITLTANPSPVSASGQPDGCWVPHLVLSEFWTSKAVLNQTRFSTPFSSLSSLSLG